MIEDDSSPPRPDPDSPIDSEAEDAGPRDDGSDRSSRGTAMRLAGLGTELAAYTLSLAGVGYMIDSIRGHEQAYATAIGTLIGFAFGMLRFVREAQKQIED